VDQAIVLGLVAGSIYGLFALGIVLVYAGSGVLNFAQAEVGTVGLFLVQVLVVEYHKPYLLAAFVGIASALLIGLAFERVAVWPLRDAPRVTVAVATLALLSLLAAVELRAFGSVPRNLDPPIRGQGFLLLGVVVTPTQILALVVVGTVAGGLALFLQRTDFGLGVLAAAQDPEAVRFLGVPLHRLSRFTWGLAAVLSAVAALLIQPSVGIVSVSAFGGIFIRALGAALIGGLSSMRGAFAGGLIVGVTEAIIRHATIRSTFTGLPELCLFLAVVATLVIRPQGLFGSR
jgi:branched-chain amino acid transport system permease protein